MPMSVRMVMGMPVSVVMPVVMMVIILTVIVMIVIAAMGAVRGMTVIAVVVTVAVMRISHGLILHGRWLASKRAPSEGGSPRYEMSTLGRAAVVVPCQARCLCPRRVMDVAREEVGDVGAGDADIGQRPVVERVQLVISRLAPAPARIGRLDMLQARKNEVKHRTNSLNECAKRSLLRCTIGKLSCQFVKGARFELSHTIPAWPTDFSGGKPGFEAFRGPYFALG